MTDDELRREGAVKALRYCAKVMEETDMALGVSVNSDLSNVCEVKYLRARADNIEAGREDIE